ncbi:hypothetical protein [Bifidobacterium moraviense]|nr:hypothetical protein [Bifidobacterium sp. DSM 109958]
MSDYQMERARRTARRRNAVRAVCLVAAVALLVSLVVPAVFYAGL